MPFLPVPEDTLASPVQRYLEKIFNSIRYYDAPPKLKFEPSRAGAKLCAYPGRGEARRRLPLALELLIRFATKARGRRKPPPDRDFGLGALPPAFEWNETRNLSLRRLLSGMVSV